MPATRRVLAAPAWLLCLVAIAALAPSLRAQTPDPGDRQLVVGTKEAPPFAIRGSDGAWTGLSIELWRRVASDLGYTFELREAELPELLAAVAAGKLDAVVAAVTVTPDREEVMDFTHPFHVSGLGMAVRTEPRGSWLAIARQFLSLAFLRIVLGLSLLLLVVAWLVWLFERRANPEQFGGSAISGIGSSFWWSAVTMTTVGYGDKAPRTVGGRAVALLWMFTALVVISGFTASIAATLTVEAREGRITGPQDLATLRIGSVAGSTSADYLEWRQLPFVSMAGAREALEALRDGRVDTVVYDAPILSHEIRQGFASALHVLPATFERQYYAIALPAGSALREPINRSLLAHISTPAWRSLLSRYAGE